MKLVTGEPSELYIPTPGLLQPTQRIQDGEFSIFEGTFHTDIADHEVRIYQLREDQNVGMSPVVSMLGGVGTGTKGHNEEVARSIAAEGATVLFKGMPHYHYPRRALNPVQEANVMHSLLDAISLNRELALGNLDKLYVYGESLGAIKQYGFTALAGTYGREVTEGLTLALCFLEKPNTWDFARCSFSVVKSLAMAALELGVDGILEQRHMLDMHDLHNHAGAIFELTQGPGGDILGNLPIDSVFTNQLYRKDLTHEINHLKEKLSVFPNMTIDEQPEFGHADGLKSLEASRIRHDVFQRIVRQSHGESAA